MGAQADAIQSSVNPVNWTNVATLAGTGSLYVTNIPITPTQPVEFFRVAEP